MTLSPVPQSPLVVQLMLLSNTSSSRVPMTDWYDTIVGTQIGFQARPVVGGFYSVLALLKSFH